ncbi:TetR/AcrR family transcriptional regulator [Paenibacillus sp. HN-1]|uniref:TetR/AcrR family transcriptional regulator n=1 Tax=Paenibacillus TaxID=44249 RepID=UPI001CA896A8|nr:MULTISPECIES: TetR/AcrR family transcriptional regulator [Paenibacillus]MBY9080300.1 TetR/AcrR family transcriptional regulator [Paenibacillus sp. CGMCC 1.18879]MBY9083041.1 TetR/AcrR family transcriptional regulator [Paenibacillus sinensis]
MITGTTKDQLIAATRQLLLSAEAPEKITARQISQTANVNLAMINYCFGSKDELLKTVIDEIIASEFKQFTAADHSQSPKEELKKLLYHMCEVTIKYESITRLTVPYVLLNAPIEIPVDVLPYIREHFKGTRDEKFCKVIAYEMVSFLQVIFYRAKDFYKYAGVDIYKEAELRELIDNQLNLLLGGDL